MSLGESANKLLQQWQAGDQNAANAIYDLYSQRLYALAEKQIGLRLQAKVDADDVVQSALGSFFWRAADGQYQVDHSGALWRLLVTITLNKIRRRAGKLDVVREIEGDRLLPEAVAHDPTQEDAIFFLDELDAILTETRKDESEIVTLCLQGYSTGEIAEQLKCSRWTVRRTLDRVGHRLRQRFAEDSSD